jgi:hypothetical protein
MGVAVARDARSFASRLEDVLNDIEYAEAASETEREEIFRLRYESYLAEGAIDPNPEHRFSDDYDKLDNCWIFGIKLAGELVSSVRFHVISKASRRGPALDVFPDIVSPMIESGMTLVDPTRLVVSRSASRHHPELPYLTVRIACMASEYFNAGSCLATVRVEHLAFYQRIFGFVPVCEPRPYPTLKRPIALMIGDMRQIRDRVADKYPVFTSTDAERLALFGRPGAGLFRAPALTPTPAMAALAAAANRASNGVKIEDVSDRSPATVD